MPDTAASRKRQNCDGCVLSPETRAQAEFCRVLAIRGMRPRVGPPRPALYMSVARYPADRQIRQCEGEINTASPAQTLNHTPDLRRHGKFQGTTPVLFRRPSSRSHSSGAS